MPRKRLTIDDLVEKAQREGLSSLTSAQLEKLSGSGKANPDDIRDALDLRLKIARIAVAKRRPGRPSRREVSEKHDDGDWLRRQEERIRGLSEEEAEDELAHMLSPAQNDLIMYYRLQRILDSGGKAGADAGRLLLEMQKRRIAPIKRLCVVKIQTAG